MMELDSDRSTQRPSDAGDTDISLPRMGKILSSPIISLVNVANSSLME